MPSCVSSAKPNAKWKAIIKNVPGYDPFRDSAGYVFDADEAERYISFFAEFLTHVEGAVAGQPFLLSPWEESVVANLFGWKDEDTGYRRYNECLVMVARKNNKSTMAGGLGAAIFALDDEPGMQVYSAAAEAEQAKLTWGIGRQMMLNNPDLADMIDSYQRVLIRKDDPMARWKYLTADASSKHGFNVHAAIVDELHVCDGELIDVIKTATGARRQPLIIYLTTSDYERPSVCNRLHKYACDVRDGVIKNPRFLPVIYEASLEDDWKSEKVWRKANPNLGISKSLDYMKSECQRAQDEPAYENTFKRLHLNIKTNSESRAIQLDQWDKCGPGATPAQLIGRQCWGGLDLGAVSDLTALRLRFPNEDGSFDGCGWFWCPKERAIEREKKDRIPYMLWASQGFITLTDGDETDYSTVREHIIAISKQYKILQIAVDRKFQGAETAQWLGQSGLNLIDFPQTFYAFTSPTAEYLRLINTGQLKHGDNPVMKWNAGNLMLKTQGEGEMKPSKDKSGNKIDGVVADIMALAISLQRKMVKTGSVYEKRGALTL